MLAAAISMDGNLFVIGGVTGTIDNPEVLNRIYVFNETQYSWDVWTTMSNSRMNHSVASYGNFMIIVGGHTLVNMIPKDVPAAVCFRIDS